VYYVSHILCVPHTVCPTYCVQGGMCPTYCVSKALLNKAGQLLAADQSFKQRGVSVVSVCPGWCRYVLSVTVCTRVIT
jgi:NAD(P)-dependent dehydrogenase (short-subunit alcohol dehydrogenase family)